MEHLSNEQDYALACLVSLSQDEGVDLWRVRANDVMALKATGLMAESERLVVVAFGAVGRYAVRILLRAHPELCSLEFAHSKPPPDSMSVMLLWRGRLWWSQASAIVSQFDYSEAEIEILD